MQNHLMEAVEQSSMKASVPKFEIGDTVDVHVRILEGEKERIQIFNGVVIAKSGTKTREMFTVRRIVQGEGVERKFPVHSPRIADIVVKRSGKVRRAKLYYLRNLSGKAVRLKERFPAGKATPAEAKAAKAERRAQKAAAKKARAEAAAEAKAEAEAAATVKEE
ncbi:MAG: 50S ribosomal protein L19 [Planctomycetaceae bacterium]|jgi:large subunit ribosomal protein L19|nr:50S ribosomal protein L19 [Planctomycetaceae bacterium]MBV8314874.1 50S ribosomal protein L19 [Planctomycetaceae bacterium]MBV8556838.1 50S ribosomal protein L19 [Planctomycetaceae bacterium]MBV8611284.1 50S ribosomal protein L19 [Singulisphaera sp.]